MNNKKSHKVYRKLNLIWIAVAIGILIISLTGCRRGSEGLTKEKVQSVKTEIIQVSSRKDISRYLGLVQAEYESELSFQISGKLISLEKNKGDFVEEGEIIATLDIEDYGLQISSANEQLKASEYELERLIDSSEYQSEEFNKTENLYDAGVISKMDYSKAELVKKQAESAVETISKRLDSQRFEIERLSKIHAQGTIFAPFSGIVDEIYVNNMENVIPGKPVVKLASEKTILSIFISMDDLPYFYEDKKIEIGKEGSGSYGKVIKVSKIADENSHLYEVNIETDYEFKLNELVICKAETNKKSGIWIPVYSVQNSSVDFVYIVENSKAVKKIVQIDDIQGDRVMIKGLNDGDKLVVSGMKTLLDGMSVKESEL